MNPARQSNQIAKWMPAAAAGGLLAAVVVAGVISGGSDDGDTADSATAAANGPTSVVATTEPLPTVTYEAVDEQADAVEKVPLSQSLSFGMSGDEVERVQQRLTDLAFDPGPVDGQFGELTTQAVWAFEKLIMGVPRQDASGVVTPDLWDRMQDPIKVRPRAPTGGLKDHVEIYLPEQTMVVFHADEPVLVAHISTGELWPDATGFTLADAAEYCGVVTIDTDDFGNILEEPYEEAQCGRSYTPPGTFAAYKKIEGRRESRLGGMYDPIYINQGIAIHGALNVPLYPASHGCIRVNRTIGGYLQSLIEIDDQVLIWDGRLEPWEQSEEAMKMRWDYKDPNATTTTTTTTTTSTTTTTTIPETTVPATTTTPPPTSTTSTTATTQPPNTTEPESTNPDNGGGGGNGGGGNGGGDEGE